jgi:hypothetical protein
MVAIENCIRIIFDQELTSTSLAFVLRSLPYISFTNNSSLYPYIQYQLLQTAVELAFQRYLSINNLPFEKIRGNPFTQPERYLLHLGGHKTLIHAQMINSKRAIDHFLKNPSLLLNHTLSFYSPQFEENRNPQNLHVFAFILASFARTLTETQRAILSGMPACWTYVLPERLRRPVLWKPLNPISIQSKKLTPLTVEIGGQDHEKRFISKLLEIYPNRENILGENFYSLTYIRSSRIPEGTISIHLKSDIRTITIPPERWKNTWIYGKEIFFMGYLTDSQLERLKARLSTSNRKTTASLMLSPKQLHPLQALFKQLRRWSDSAGKL